VGDSPHRLVEGIGKAADVAPRSAGYRQEMKLTTTSASPETVARRLIDEGFSQGLLAVVDELVAPHMKEHQARGPGHPDGPGGVKAVIETLRSAFADFRLAIEDLAVAGDTVWTRNVATGIHRGPFRGLQPTGRPICVTVFDVMRIRNGQVVEHWGLPDHMTMMTQLRA
jgi:predicted ester cyclase